NAENVRAVLDRGIASDDLTVAFAVASGANNSEMVDLLKQAGARAPFEVDAQTLNAYAGKYAGGHGVEIKITVNDGHLYASHELQEPIRLVPIEETRFRPVAFDNVTITFNTESGTVTGLDFKLNGAVNSLKRVS